jgi:hypothetical protein
MDTFFNLNKAHPLDLKYVQLRNLLFRSMRLYKSHGRNVKSSQNEIIENHEL